MTVNLVWFREDLRVRDNPALYYASRTANVAAVYVFSPMMLEKHNVSGNKIAFMLNGLQQVQDMLAKKNISLKFILADGFEEIKKQLLNYAILLKAECLYFNKQYEVNELQRDQLVEKYFEENGIAVKTFHDQCLFEPGTVLTHSQTYYQVYTPFKNACWAKIREGDIATPLPEPAKQERYIGKNTPIATQFPNISLSQVQAKILPGEKVAKKQLANFIENKILHYKKHRDFPAVDGTSKLSPYFSSGMISTRQCFHAVMTASKNGPFDLSEGPVTWLNELLWREFYRHILFGFPRVCKNQPFKLFTNKITWQDNDALLQKWQEGNTGYPIVDAAMRQLNQTGWMHNRLRMIVAMFFTKNLFLDWRLGEKYFMQHLIDGDLASNNGGWQWSASTGVDAVPYFRIFNPVRQSQRFDPEGKFIRQYVPELKNADNKIIHHPSDARFNSSYPKAIVDISATKEKVITAFKKLHF